MPRGGLRKTDEELQASGTFRPSRSNAAKDRRLAENIFAGPGFQDVPDPEYPLGNFGQRKYFELCGRLLNEGKLCAGTRATAEQVAILMESQRADMASGKRVPAYLTREISKQLALLRLAEDLTPIGGNVSVQQKPNRFAACGAILASFAPGRVRDPAAP